MLSDIFPTGHHGAYTAGTTTGSTEDCVESAVRGRPVIAEPAWLAPCM